jgi:AbrB family looped-hinge helix DNA binding protein
LPIELKVKVVKIGHSLRITVPKEVAEALGLQEGDVVSVGLSNARMVVRKFAG